VTLRGLWLGLPPPPLPQVLLCASLKTRTRHQKTGAERVRAATVVTHARGVQPHCLSVVLPLLVLLLGVHPPVVASAQATVLRVHHVVVVMVTTRMHPVATVAQAMKLQSSLQPPTKHHHHQTTLASTFSVWVTAGALCHIYHLLVECVDRV
jgi:hypothetical protein